MKPFTRDKPVATSMNGDVDYESWDAVQLQVALKQYNISDAVVNVFKEQAITGVHLKHLTLQRFQEFKLRLGHWYDFMYFLEKLEHERAASKVSSPGKIFNDPIHGNILLNPVCLAIIDTPQFQRLRYLKQLGLVYFVYPGAAHNRFEHSLGVCYLAGQYVRYLKENQNYLGITEQDILCVEVAALCHDIGHGPFSHTFDQMVIPSVLPDRKPQWTHEQASKDMFDYLVNENELDKEGGIFERYGINNENDMLFIKELISPLASKHGEWPHRGRTKEKAFLYEIIANKRNNIDVDKWDYMARDCHQLGIKNNFDHTRFVKFARVIAVDDELQICLRDKEVLNLYNMFSTRYTLHKVAYQHQVSRAMALMVAHALIKANDYVHINGSDGKRCKISECIDDMAAYTHLTDDIIFKILDTESEETEMMAAKELIQRLFNRDLYKCVYQSKPIDPKNLKYNEATISQELINISKGELRNDDFVVEIVRLDFGRNDENPIERLHVYSKHSPDKGRRFPKEEASRIVATNYTEWIVRVYSCQTRKDKSFDKMQCDNKSREINETCEKWFTDNFQAPQENED